MLTVKQTARRLNTSPSTIYRLIAEGELPCRRLRRSIRISQSVLMEFIETRSKA